MTVDCSGVSVVHVGLSDADRMVGRVAMIDCSVTFSTTS